MSPGIQDGDLVLVRQQPNAEIGQVAVVREDNEGFIKRLGAVNGCIELRSDNPFYTPLNLPRAEIVGRSVKVIKDLYRPRPTCKPEPLAQFWARG